MAARWQQQEINTFTTVLSLQSIQFHGLCSDRPRSELKHECIKCAYMWSTQCCHIRSVDSLVFLDFLSYCEWFLAQMKEMQRQTLWAPVPLWRFRMHKSPRRFTFPFNIDQNIQPIGLLKITHSENTQRDDRCFFPTKYAKIHLLRGRDPLRVRAMFFKCACLDWSEGLDWAFSVAGPVCWAAVWDQMRAPCVHARLSKPHRLVPVEPRPLVHSSNLISCDFITGGGRRTSEGSHLEKYNCLSALAFALTFEFI